MVYIFDYGAGQAFGVSPPPYTDLESTLSYAQDFRTWGSLDVLRFWYTIHDANMDFSPLGGLVDPEGCVDPYNKTRHPFGTKWDTANCLRCSCTVIRLKCCAR